MPEGQPGGEQQGREGRSARIDAGIRAAMGGKARVEAISGPTEGRLFLGEMGTGGLHHRAPGGGAPVERHAARNGGHMLERPRNAAM